MKRWLVLSQLAQAKKDRELVAGYTITEAMIVLAVVTVMFAVIAVVFSGRQGRVEFTESVRNFEAKLQNIVSDVTNGYYNPNFDCRVSTSGPPTINSGGGSGSSGHCIFLGKFILPVEGEKASTISTIVGRRVTEAGAEVQSLNEAHPVRPPMVDERYSHSFQLEVRRIVMLDDPSKRMYGVGFLTELSRGVGVELSASEGVVRMYTLSSPSLVASGNIVDLANLSRASEGVMFCLRGNNNQRAEIKVGTRDSQDTVFSELDTGNEPESPCYEA